MERDQLCNKLLHNLDFPLGSCVLPKSDRRFGAASSSRNGSRTMGAVNLSETEKSAIASIDGQELDRLIDQAICCETQKSADHP
jgi:hypothetical protein